MDAIPYEAILEEPSFGYGTEPDRPYHPTLREVLVEWVDSINFIKNRWRAIPAGLIFCQFLTFIAFVVYAVYYASFFSALAILVLSLLICNVYGDIWFHRYCSHRAFEFSSPIINKIFLWMNPTLYREDSYVIQHRIHHRRADRRGDPVGPHLGRIGSFLASEWHQKLNTNIDARAYESVTKSMSHIRMPMQSYEEFQKSGCIENPVHLVLRTLTAHLFFGGLFFAIGGKPLLAYWYASIFVTLLLGRDFSWRSHAGKAWRQKAPLTQPGDSYATNQMSTGFFSSDWHINHHRYPMSANTALERGQVDLAFQIIRFFFRLGIVRSYQESPRNSR